MVNGEQVLLLRIYPQNVHQPWPLALKSARGLVLYPGAVAGAQPVFTVKKGAPSALRCGGPTVIRRVSVCKLFVFVINT